MSYFKWPPSTQERFLQLLYLNESQESNCIRNIRQYSPVSANSRGGGGFTNVSQAVQNNLAKLHNIINHISVYKFKLKLYMCSQSMALYRLTKFKLENLIKVQFLQYTNFKRIFWRAPETLVKQPPSHMAQEEISEWFHSIKHKYIWPFLWYFPFPP